MFQICPNALTKIEQHYKDALKVLTLINPMYPLCEQVMTLFLIFLFHSNQAEFVTVLEQYRPRIVTVLPVK